MDGLLDVLVVPRVGLFRSRRQNRGLTLRRGERRGGFWVRNAAQLDGMLYDISVCHARTIRRVHPDAPGGSHEKAVAVTLAWTKVKRLFAQRGVTLS